MKWFLELGSCWGGATVTPAAETVQTSSKRQLEEVNRAPIRGRSKNTATMDWKPKLHVISEDNVIISEVDKRSQQRTVGSDKKASVKVKPKAKVKVRTPTYHGEDYWKSSHPMPVAAFSPTPFLF